MLELLAVVGFLALYALMWGSAGLCIRWHMRRYAPEVMLLPTEQQRELLRGLAREEFSSSEKDHSWRAKLRDKGLLAIGLLAVFGVLAAVVQLRFPLWTAVFISAGVMLPLLRLVNFHFERARMRKVARIRLIRAGILICPSCGQDLCGTRPPRCPSCDIAIDWDTLVAPLEGDEAIGSPLRPATQPSRFPIPSATLLAVVLLLVLALPIPFVFKVMEGVGEKRQHAWHKADVPADSLIEVDSADTYGIFVRADCSAEVVSGPAVETPPSGLRIQVLRTATGESLNLETPSTARGGRRWDADGTPVRIVRRVDIPCPGSFRLIVDGDPGSGPVFWRPRLLEEHLRMIALLASPLAACVAIIVLVVGCRSLRRRREVAHPKPAG